MCESVSVGVRESMGGSVGETESVGERRRLWGRV